MLNKDNFLVKLNEIYNEDIVALDDYVNARTPIKFFCKRKNENGEEHGEFKKTPYELITLKRPCPICLGNVKPKGYWNTLEHCIEEAKKYKNKHELERKCYGCYFSFYKHNWTNVLNEIYKDTVVNYSNPYDKIHCVYVYEIKETKTCYIGRTNNLGRRDKQHRKGILKHGEIIYDKLYKYCNTNDIILPQPIILEEKLNAVESQEKEDYWVNEYRVRGWSILNMGKTGIGVGSLGACLKWTYEKCKEVSRHCKNKEEMKKKNQSAYNSARKNGWLNEFFIQTKKPNGYWNVLEHCIEEAKKYKNAKEFSLKGGGAYNASVKNNFLGKLKYNE